METTLLKLTVDYLNAQDATVTELSDTLPDMQKAKEYEAIQWAEFVLQNLDRT